MKTRTTMLCLTAMFTAAAIRVLAAELSLESAPPVVVKTAPVAGATDVDPALTEIKVTFSKAMQDGSWSWSTWGEENFPELGGKPKYLADGRTCVLTVKLQPQKFYAIWLNSDKFKNFKDTAGRAAVPYLLTFFTGESGASRSPATEITAAEGVGAAVAQKIKSEVASELKKRGAKADELLVTVAVARDSATPFKVTYRGLRNFKGGDGRVVSPPDGDFIMNYIGGGQWQGALAGVMFTAEVGSVDKTDLPFVNDPSVLGEWESLDFVASPAGFNPDKRAWRGDLYLKGLNFLENGKFPEAWQTWTRGVVIHSGDKTSSRYELKEIKGQTYLFFEWKSGDVTILGRKPSYYVLRKVAAANAIRSSGVAGEGAVEREVDKLVSDFPMTNDLSTPEGACAAWQRANAAKDAQAISKLSLVPLDPKAQEAWYQREEKRDPEGQAMYLKALAESKIVAVQVYRGELANVVTFLPFPEGKGRHPYSARSFGLVNGAWKNLGEDRLPDLESAKAIFETKKERLWQRFVELKGESASIAAPAELSLAKLNDDQRAILAWTDRQFRSFFDARTFDGWSAEERANLEKRLIDALSGPRSRDYYQAIGSLAALRSTNALPKLREIAFDRADKDCRDRWMAIRALGIIGDKTAVPELAHLVYHGNTNTRWWAQISLVRLTGQNFAGDWKAWGDWWNQQGGQPVYNPEIVRWWSGQAETEKLKESLEPKDRDFLNSIKSPGGATSATEQRGEAQSGEQYLKTQIEQAKAGNFWAKFKVWEALSKGAHGVAQDSGAAEKWLAELVAGAYLAKFEPVNGFNPRTPGEMLQEFGAHSQLRSGKDNLGGASFFRTTQQGDKLVGSFLTGVPDEFRTAVQANPNFKLISIEKLTPEMFLKHEASRQESL